MILATPLINNFKVNNSFDTKKKEFKHSNNILKSLYSDKISFSALKKNKQGYETDIIKIFSSILPKKPNLTQKDLNNVLITMNKDFLKGKYKDEWTKENPTKGYCYAVTEFIHYFVNPNTRPYCISYDNGTTHWFLKNTDNEIIDFTSEQFKGQTPEYDKARPNGFLTDYPSKRACEIAVRLGIISREAANEISKVQKKLRNAKNKQEELQITSDFKKI